MVLKNWVCQGRGWCGIHPKRVGSSLTLPWISDAATTTRINREEVGSNWELAWLLWTRKGSGGAPMGATRSLSRVLLKDCFWSGMISYEVFLLKVTEMTWLLLPLRLHWVTCFQLNLFFVLALTSFSGLPSVSRLYILSLCFWGGSIDLIFFKKRNQDSISYNGKKDRAA